MTKLFKHSRLSGLASVFTTIGAAMDVARAVETHTMPPRGALKTLGIDENEFRRTHVR